MKNSWPTRIFFFFGILLWVPIIIGIAAMIHLAQFLAVIFGLAFCLVTTSLLLSALIKQLI